MELLILEGCQVVEGGMQSAMIVIGDPAKDLGAGLRSGAEVITIDQLDLERSEEAFRSGIVKHEPTRPIDC